MAISKPVLGLKKKFQIHPKLIYLKLKSVPLRIG